jgi:SpoVK/Ycf46/Vps4 family AAA+-type ATPase
MNIKASSILSKYIGESDKMVSAIFRLGRKLAPTVIFIDEIDTVLRKRSSFDNSGGAVQSMQVGSFLCMKKICETCMRCCFFEMHVVHPGPPGPVRPTQRTSFIDCGRRLFCSASLPEQFAW